MDIREDDLRGPEIAALLETHLAMQAELSPPESVHALDLAALRVPEITFFTAWENGELAGCGALKRLDAAHGEIKSMHTAAAFRRRGVAAAILERIIAEAGVQGLKRISLETGSMPEMAPARALYARHGFVECGPFGDYREDPFATFMTLDLAAG